MKVSARLQPATAGHARLMLSKTVLFYAQACAVRVDSLPHRKWKEIKQQPGTAGPGNILGCCLVSFHLLFDIHSITLYRLVQKKGLFC